MIEIIKDKDLIFDVNQYDVVLVGTSILNALGNGFQHKIKLNFNFVDSVNKSTNYDDLRKLGTVRVVDSTPIFCLCYINKSRRRPDLNPDYLDYDALESCMKIINDNFKGKKICSTILGHSKYEGGGNKERIMKIIEENSSNINLFLYDYEQTDYKEDRNIKWKNIVDNIGNLSQEEYRKKKKEYIWENAFGELSEVPYDMSEHEIRKYIENCAK